MNQYIVAFYSNFTGVMDMDEVLAHTALEAGKKYLLDSTDNETDALVDIDTMQKLRNLVFDQDHAIGVYQINKRSSKSSTYRKAVQQSIQ